MSLVERALKKLQENRASAVASPIVAAESDPATLPIAEVPRPSAMSDPVPGISLEAEVIRLEAAKAKVRVDRSALRELGVLPPEAQERLIAEQYRQIKRLLIANMSAKSELPIAHPRLIMMTSALPGDGKTFTSVNLALSLGREKDTTCLLIDADVAKPHVSNLFGVSEERGLLDALTDDSIDVESLILPTEAPGLYILPAGKQIEGATELLASTRMQQILARLESGNPRRISLFDSPPLLPSSESRVLVNLMGQVVLVVRAGITPRQAVFDAISHVNEGTYVGVILNQSEAAPSGGYYGYGYGVYGAAPPTDR
jgi:protein-tyrosine kinase